MHIPKTAGTSLKGLVRRRYAQPGALQLEYEREATGPPRPGDPRLKIVMGHFRYGYHEKIARPCSYSTFLRHPIDQVVSHYCYYLDHPQAFQSMKSAPGNVLDFALGPYGYNFQTRFVSGWDAIAGREDEALERARANLRSFAMVGLTEEFDLSVLMLARLLNWRICYYETINKGRSSRQNFELSAGEERELTELLAPDMALYRQARQQWQMQKEAWPGAETALRRFQFENRIFQKLNPAYTQVKQWLNLVAPHPVDRS